MEGGSAGLSARGLSGALQTDPVLHKMPLIVLGGAVGMTMPHVMHVKAVVVGASKDGVNLWTVLADG